MLIFIDFKIESTLEERLISDNVIYRPDIESKTPRNLQRALLSNLPDVLITRTIPDEDVALSWKKECPQTSIFIIYIGEDKKLIDNICNIPVHHISPVTEEYPELKAFVLSEKINSLNLVSMTNTPLLASIKSQKESEIIIVGAGVVNLMTAYYLNLSGYKIKVYDAGLDPRITAEEKRTGSTHGGGDARMFSLSETRHHLTKSHLDITHNGVCSPFKCSFSKGGWLTCDENRLNGNDSKWESDFENVPSWLPPIFENDLISFNQESKPLWDDLINKKPDLFKDVGYTPKVLRLYSTHKQFSDAIIIEGRINSTKRIMEADALKKEHPALAEAIEKGSIVGGIEVVGFTVNIHKFSRKLLKYLESSGVVFHWGKKIDSIERNSDSSVIGLKSSKEIITADHYVISPGAYGAELLDGTLSQNKISSIVGSWLRIPNIGPKLDVSLKISRSGFASDGAAVGANILIGMDSQGKDIIHISSGHGYVGEDPNNIDKQYVEDLFRVVEETAKKYFPNCYKNAKESGVLKQSLKYCVRPWTPSGLGIFEISKAENDGLLIITGGHNTGGFAQSPSVAMAVLTALNGNLHAMHSAYHPKRVDYFTSYDERRTVHSGFSKSEYELLATELH